MKTLQALLYFFVVKDVNTASFSLFIYYFKKNYVSWVFQLS